jgi:hypothetical protein
MTHVFEKTIQHLKKFAEKVKISNKISDKSVIVLKIN